MFKQVGDKWFSSRSGQSNLKMLPRLPMFVRSSKAQSQKTSNKQPKAPTPFIVGESVAGGEEVAM